MAGGGFGKAILKEIETSSEESSAPLINRRIQILGPRNPQLEQASTSKPSTSGDYVPKKAINLLRAECKENRRKSRTKLLEILMDRPNPDAGKTIVVDIDSEDEFDEVLDELNKKDLPLKKRMWLWKTDDYSHSDAELRKAKLRTHGEVSFGVTHPDELKSLISVEYSHYIVQKYNVKVPSGWTVSVPTDMERVCLYQFNKTALYPDAFHYGMQLPFNPFIKDIFNYFFIAPSQITPNSWRILRAFEAICFHVCSRPTARSFHYFFNIKRGNTDWAYFSKRADFDNVRMMGGLDDSVPDWKEYFWKVQIHAGETRFGFQETWVKPIHKGELPFKYLGPHDKTTVTKVHQFVTQYLEKHGKSPRDELDAEEVVKRYLKDDFIFELPAAFTQAEGDVSACKPPYTKHYSIHYSPLKKPCRIVT